MPDKPTNLQRQRGTGSIRIRQDGTLEGRVRLDGQLVTVYAKTPADCHAKLNKLLADRDKGLAPARSRVTFEAFAGEWIEIRRHDWEPATLIDYRALLANHVYPHIGRLQVRAITPQHVQAVVTACHARQMAAKTITKVKGVMRGVLGLAVEYELIPRNVTDSVRVGKTSGRMKKTPYSLEDSRRLIDAYTALIHAGGDPFGNRCSHYSVHTHHTRGVTPTVQNPLTRCGGVVIVRDMQVIVRKTRPNYGTRVFDVLRSRGIRHDWFCRQIGFTQSYVSHIRAGRRPITERFMSEAARVLALPEDMLFFELPSLSSDETSPSGDDTEQVA